MCKIIGPFVGNPEQQARELSNLFCNPHRARRRQSALKTVSEVVAFALASARAVESHGVQVENVPAAAEKIDHIGSWVVLPNGKAVPTNGGVYNDETLWLTNADDPTNVLMLRRGDCGVKYWASFGTSRAQAIANQASAKARELCAMVKTENPNNVFRRSWV